MYRKVLASLIGALALTLTVFQPRASANPTWMTNHPAHAPVMAVLQHPGAVFIQGQTRRTDLGAALYYYQFLAYDGRWIDSFQRPFWGFNGRPQLVRAFPGGLPAGLTIRVRADHDVVAITSH